MQVKPFFPAGRPTAGSGNSVQPLQPADAAENLGAVLTPAMRARPLRNIFTITATNGSGATQTFRLFGNDNGALSTAAPAPPSGVTIGGTWGTDSHRVISRLSESNPVLIGSMRVEVSDEVVFNTLNARFLSADWGGNQDVVTVNLSAGRRPLNYDQTQLFYPDINITLDAFTALVVTLPDTRSVTFDFEVKRVASLYIMR